MHLQIETVTTTQGRMDVIRDVEAALRLNDVAERLAHRLRLWSTGDGEMLCSEDAEALKEWDALSLGGSDAPKWKPPYTCKTYGYGYTYGPPDRCHNCGSDPAASDEGRATVTVEFTLQGTRWNLLRMILDPRVKTARLILKHAKLIETSKPPALPPQGQRAVARNDRVKQHL